MLAVSEEFQNALVDIDTIGDRNIYTDKETLRFAWLVELPADIRLTDHATDLTWQGQLYVSQGDILSLPSIVREREIKLQSYTLRISNVDLSNIDQTPLDKLTSQNFTGAICNITLVLLREDGSIIDGINMYRGTFHTWTENETDTSATMNITLTSPWSKPNLTAGRVTSNNNQTDLYSGDKFFEFAHRERDSLGWGAKE